ncbi:PP2C family protein-serine/threonine phosphatase [Pectinatus haikarae]|uniref:Serine phosphatase RsbU (Regulator of sigma subunit) n=1 Tax=Pectinatus haikarae TaxID=349096 RepID=A0ABT9Y6L2_9FIRM|nr:PP2C family protein-serine/threonine phosphatase [Pectinatus haikarae]MDQ0203160.1 serine phosphatase RsbU (regulator of sigma subunit) [Pectinatus haikarae]
MEIKVAVAKTTRYAMEFCGDTCDIAERPQGGLSLILADGQGHGLSAHHTSSLVVNKAVSLIGDGTRDGAVARAVHDYLYAVKDKKVSCTLTVVSADLDTQTMVISRNSNCPVIIKTDEYTCVYDESVNPIGVHHHTKPVMYEVPMEEGMVIISYTDGIQSAGRKTNGKTADFKKILAIAEHSRAEDAEFIADSIMAYALKLDENKAGDDMTVVVMGVCGSNDAAVKIRKVNVNFPL